MRQSVTDATFAAFLHCETKAFLFNEGVAGTCSDVNSWELRRARAFKASSHRLAEIDGLGQGILCRPASGENSRATTLSNNTRSADGDVGASLPTRRLVANAV